MKKLHAVIIGSALFLGGCGSDVKKTLGLERSAPDEFAVIERAPLTLPPNYTLVPPEPGAERPQEVRTVDAAKGLVLSSKSSAPKPNDVSRAEQSLLSKANVATSDPSIRQELNNPPEPEKKTAAEKLGLVSPESRSDKALDAVAEAEKLNAQKAKTKAPTSAPKNAPKNAK